MKKIAGAAVGLLLAGCASSGSALMWTRPGVSFEEYSTDADQCTERMHAARNSVPNPSVYSPPSSGGAGALGAAFGAGLARGMAQGRAMREAYESCYRERGYTQVPMPKEEVLALRAAPREGEARVRVFYDIATRLAPPLPVEQPPASGPLPEVEVAPTTAPPGLQDQGADGPVPSTP